MLSYICGNNSGDNAGVSVFRHEVEARFRCGYNNTVINKRTAMSHKEVKG